MSNKKTYLKRTIAWVFVFAMCSSIFAQTASALSQKQLNQFINKSYYYNVDECAPDQSSGSVTAGSGAPSGAAFPNLNPASMATAIDKWVKKANPNSKMNGLGETIVAGAKQSDVNPFLIVVIARMESSMSDPSDYNVSNGSNSFGRTATSSQPNFQGAALWYKWSSVKASVDHTAPENRNIQGGGDFASYLRNQYDDQIRDNDLTALMMEYAPPSENDTGAYVQNIKDWTRELIRETGSSTGTATVSSGGQATGGGGGANCGCGPDQSGSTTLSGSNNEEKVWNYFKGKGFEDHLVAGIMGNIAQESGFEADKQQVGGPAYGLIQWDPVAGNSLDYWMEQAKVTGDRSKLETQLEVIWWHLNNLTPRSLKNALPEFKKSKNVKEATDAWEYWMEGAGIPMMENRYAAAEAAMKKYGGSGGGATGSSSSGESCVCEPSSGKTVVLDPGHSGQDITERDPSGIVAFDYYNAGETEDMWKTSQIITEKLEEAGYNVINTKKSAKDTVGLIERAKIANNADAAIAVSLHSTPGTFGSANTGWVTPQETGLYRQSGTNKKTFTDEKTAKTSQEYAQKILEARKQKEGGVKINRIPFAGRGLPATGNISIVQLFSKVPWVYNEVGQTGFNANTYAEGIAQGIIRSVGQASDGSVGNCSGGGDLIGTVKQYAWPDYKGRGFTEPKQEYRQAIRKAQSTGRYVGGASMPGIDCGGFISLAMFDSGYEPGYNHDGKGSRTGDSPAEANSQWNWLDKNWKKINPSSTKDLQPGDVAINSGHTYMYVGEVDGFNSVIASASLESRAPMAGEEAPADPDYSWYRKQ